MRSFPNIQLMTDANHGCDINEAIVTGKFEKITILV